MKNENTINSKFSLTSILVEDKKTKGFTAFFKQFPDIITEGDTIKEAITNLVHALSDVINDKSYLAEETCVPTQNTIEKKIEFQCAW